MMTENLVRKMERDAFELASGASIKYQYSELFQERLTAVLLANLIQKCGVQNYDYQEFLRVLEYNTQQVPFEFDAIENPAQGTVYFCYNKEVAQQVINNMPTCNDTTAGLLKKKVKYNPRSFSNGTIDIHYLDHELKHLINSYHNSFKGRGQILYNRSGLCYFTVNEAKAVNQMNGNGLDETHTVKEGLKLEPTLNLLATYKLQYTNIGKIICENKSRRQYLANSGYRDSYKIVKPILDALENELEVASYYGNLRQFAMNFNQICQDKYAFETLNNALDDHLKTTVGLFLKNKFNHETASPQELEEKQKASLLPINAIVKKFQKGYQKQKI